MTEPYTEQPRSPATSRRRYRTLLYVGIPATALVIAAGVTLLVKLPGGPPPVDYHVSVTGNISASWESDDGDGTIDLTNLGNSAKIRASSLTITVHSTMPSGASCSIVDLDAKVVDTQIAFPARGARGEDAATTVTCSTEKH